jgi:long-chain acyl-CoA synthetase
MLPNLPQTVVAYWAALKAGAVVVMVNPLSMESELTHQIPDAGCEFMIVLDRLWPRISALVPKLPVRRFVVTRVEDGLSQPWRLLYRLRAERLGERPEVPFDGNKVISWKEAGAGRSRLSVDVPEPRRDLALLQYTCGTTGRSKGVMITHANLSANLVQCRALLSGLGEAEERFLALLPFFHVYGLTVGLNLATSIGATIIPVPRYQPGELLALIERERPTIFPGAPAVYASLLGHKDVGRRDLSSLRWCVSGSAAMPEPVSRRFTELTGAEIVEGYGLTEASPVTHLSPLRGQRQQGSIGLPLPDTDCRIVDLEDGVLEVPQGQPGELAIRGPQVAAGYWRQPEETAATFRNGWLHTGDVAVLDADGSYRIVDRKKDMVVVCGFNVAPREVEETLILHPGIREACVVGAPHAARGETVKAFVVSAEGAELTRADVVTWCRERIAHYKVPREVVFLDALPKNNLGKVLRRVLRSA